ncbi:MAG: DUF488 family protein [Lactobacillus sp.]|jgi:uncharacterized protein YeaO (DUF488 family)|nr:DUF488 family protein [Lactobacillus sp.]MCH3905727.1 DUF488 family protein [Lactobacillus sp.]MCH3990704.1 DUF488 family protein [Lactobacillus sp.]MCH4068580.1 DUF488 family protein [Lactobacillus sp.]MCI1304125.1 DUF488 family protein [Lactobacillus sp.]
MGTIKVIRIYEHEQPAGYRILVDRIWPRGISKVKAQLDLWAKEIGPSTELRKWFNHDDAKFADFKQKYLAELAVNPAAADFVTRVQTALQQGDVLFLYGAKNKEHNQAVVLKEFVDQKSN